MAAKGQKRMHTVEEFDYYVQHCLIAFCDVRTTERIRVLRKYAR
jgi:hypothetical protein